MNKLIISIPTLGQGGAERVVSIISESFLEYFSEVEIVLWKSNIISYNMNPKIIIIDISKIAKTNNLIHKMFWFRKYLIKNDNSIVLSFLTTYNMIVIVSSLFLKNKVFVADRSNPWRVPNNCLLRKLRNICYYFANGLIVQNETNKKYFPQLLQGRLSIIPNPIFISDDDVGIGVTSKKNKEIVAVGRLISVKNHQLLIRAFAVFYETHNDYKLLIYGEGEKRDELQRVITDLGMDEVITLCGNVTDIHLRIKSAEIFVHTSLFEGMPNALIEAMAIGLPVITTRFNGVDEIVENGVDGLILPSNDKEALTNMLDYLINNRGLRTALAMNAIRVYDKLNKEGIIALWIKVLNN